MREEDRHRLAQLFRSTGEDHHQAFIQTDGEDPEWPLWYAEHLLERLRRMLDPDLTKSELVYRIVAVERERARRDPEAEWPDYYAGYFLEHLE